jgi:hypothetical protein
MFDIFIIIGFCQMFYFAIGKPSNDVDTKAIGYFYVDFVCKLIAEIHGIKVHKENIAYYQVQDLINRYYKFLGFCYICFSSWIGIIYFNMDFQFLGLFFTINLITNKWIN